MSPPWTKKPVVVDEDGPSTVSAPTCTPCASKLVPKAAFTSSFGGRAVARRCASARGAAAEASGAAGASGPGTSEAQAATERARSAATKRSGVIMGGSVLDGHFVCHLMNATLVGRNARWDMPRHRGKMLCDFSRRRRGSDGEVTSMEDGAA